MDTGVENAFYLFHRDDGSYMKYTCCATLNLYTYVVRVEEEHKVLLHSTVEGESDKFSQIDQTQAKTVREMQEVMASSNYDLANSIENNVVGSTPFIKRDVRIATIIHSCDVAGMKGKTTKTPSKIPNPNEVRDVPSHIAKNYSEVSLYINVMPINDIMFLVEGSKHIGLIQCVCIRKKSRELYISGNSNYDSQI